MSGIMGGLIGAMFGEMIASENYRSLIFPPTFLPPNPNSVETLSCAYFISNSIKISPYLDNVQQSLCLGLP